MSTIEIKKQANIMGEIFSSGYNDKADFHVWGNEAIVEAVKEKLAELLLDKGWIVK